LFVPNLWTLLLRGSLRWAELQCFFHKRPNMVDLLVKLYDIPDPSETLAALAAHGIVVRRAMANEKTQVADWIRNRFGDRWAAECEAAFARQPIACFIALYKTQMVGFACHDATCANFFGPIGIDPVSRHKGVGRALLLATLQSMHHGGYAYAIVGSAGPEEFFEKCAGAIAIPGSTPGIYPSTTIKRQ
jgi:GNAT superfamily N-acetyltransferase